MIDPSQDAVTIIAGYGGKGQPWDKLTCSECQQDFALEETFAYTLSRHSDGIAIMLHEHFECWNQRIRRQFDAEKQVLIWTIYDHAKTEVKTGYAYGMRLFLPNETGTNPTDTIMVANELESLQHIMQGCGYHQIPRDPNDPAECIAVYL